MCRFGLLVSTCAYFRGRWATCAQLDYLCLTCAYLRYMYLHLHSFCIDNLPVQTFYTSGMISLSNINPPVLKKWFHYLGMHSFLQKKCRNVQKYDALLMQFWCNFETTSFWCTLDVVSKGFWCTFDVVSKTASKLHRKCIMFFDDFQHFFWKKTVEMSKKYDALLMQFWCSFETTSFWCTFDVVSRGFDAFLM